MAVGRLEYQPFAKVPSLKNLILLLSALLFLGCFPEPPYYNCNGDEKGYCISSYQQVDEDFSQTAVTEKGIRVDTSGNDVDLAALDRLVDEFELCNGDVTVDRTGFKVKIASGWYVSECTGNQKFDCEFQGGAPPSTTGCSVGCAGSVIKGNLVVVTPNLAALKHELTHLVFDIEDHSHERFKCE